MAKLFKEYKVEEKPNGVIVTHYKPNFPIWIDSFDMQKAEFVRKKILDYSKHENIKMYKIFDPFSRFSPFWASSDHSLVCFCNSSNKIEKVSPIDISKNPSTYRLIKLKDGEPLFIPAEEIIIVEDSSKTTGYDFTVEDTETFVTSDGVVVYDTVAIYRPLSPVAKIESKRMNPRNTLFSPANYKLQYLPAQDIVYGIYRLSKTEKGKELLSKILDVDITYEVDKKKLVELISNYEDPAETLDVIKVLGLSEVVREPTTLSIEDFDIEKPKELTGDREEDIKISEELKQVLQEKFSKGDIVRSGSRGSWDQVQQMIMARGYVSDFFGNIVPVPVKSAYIEGLTPDEYFISAYGTRKSILDVASNTSESGYLTRRLIFSTITTVLGDKEDCGTDRYIVLENIDEKLARALRGRFMYNDDNQLEEITEPEKIIGKTIRLRSPITCRSKKICKTCYGTSWKLYAHSKLVGIIASQTLGERSTQLVLRTFHTGGVAQGKTFEKQEDIVSSLKEVTKILDKQIQVNSLEEVVKITRHLYDIFRDYGDILFIHPEIITTARMWKMNETKTGYRRWRLLNDNNFENVYLLSLKTIPGVESWLLGMIFQAAKKNFLRGIMTKKSSGISELEKISLGLL